MIKEIEWKQKDFVPVVGSVLYDKIRQKWLLTEVINSVIISARLELLPPHGSGYSKDNTSIEHTVQNLLKRNRPSLDLWITQYRNGYKQALFDIIADLRLNIEEE